MSQGENNFYNYHSGWGNDIKNYENEKKNLQWGQNPKPEIITNKMVKEKENIFNPISQLYYDHNYDKTLRESENKKVHNSISKNYDKALRNEQTFDIVNLKDKLKGFEGHPDYPVFKTDSRKKKLENTKVGYNILSNIGLDKHNFLPPEKRPNINNEEENQPKTNKVNAVNYKDYDIISNKYKFNHEQKLKADLEIEKLNAARNYWKNHDYDLVQARYVDDKKEEEFLKKRSKNEKNREVKRGHQE